MDWVCPSIVGPEESEAWSEPPMERHVNIQVHAVPIRPMLEVLTSPCQVWCVRYLLSLGGQIVHNFRHD
ncbi:MAG TPA: hypothetical protein VL981_09600 [Candidatus Methylacidiphilales bacterium]|nr:hypothetical protein [Candidatus Methylacidiphilales bacterium]